MSKKNGQGFFEMLFLLVVLCFAFGAWGSGATGKKGNKRKWFGIALIVLGIGWLGYNIWDAHNPVQDCVPATLSRIFPEYSTKEMRKICYTERDGTLMADFFYAWEELTTNKLEVLFTTKGEQPAKRNVEFDLDKTYLWLGEITQGHCALIQFSTNGVVMSNSEYVPGTTNWYCINFSYKDFFMRTWFIMDAPELEKVRFK